MNSKNNQKKKAQILVITLLVLMILAVIVISVVSLATKDADQVVANKKYTEIFNETENKLNQLVREFGIQSVPATLPANCAVSGTGGGYKCDLSSTIDGKTFLTVVTVNDSSTIDGLKISKDRSFEMSLEIKDATGTVVDYYRGGIILDWDKAAALDFTVTYRNPANGNALGVIKDVYDLSNVYTSSGGDPYNPANHLFNFVAPTTDAGLLPTTTRININSIDGVSGMNPVSLRITPRMSGTDSEISLDVTGAGATSLPAQIRQFIATGYIQNDPNTPVVKIETSIPIGAQTDSIFDYAFLTDDEIVPE
jgi:hypothetical protein